VRVLAIVHQRDAGPGVFTDRIRARGTLETWYPAEEPEPPDPEGFGAALTFGGAMHADQGADHAWIETELSLISRLLDLRVPTLGVCLGTQLLAAAAGAEVKRAAEPEIGWREVELTGAGAADPVLGSLPDRFTAFQWHSYETALPPGAVPLARSPVCLQGYRIGSHAWGIQFHAEVSAADAQHWISDYRSDPDAVRIGVEPGRLREETATRIAAWNEAGRELCDAFLDYASSHPD
jgi:GMP synthase-like glutamine amidotransferase